MLDSLVDAIVVMAVLSAIVIAKLVVLQRRRTRDWQNLDQAGVQRGLAILLRRGYGGATAVFSDAAGDIFLQFRKYITAERDIGVEMHFPRAKWSQSHYAGVLAVLQERHVAFERVPLSTEGTTEVIHVDFGTNIEAAAQTTAEIVRRVFGRPVSLLMQADDLCPENVLVVSANHPRPPAILARRLGMKP